MEHEEYQYLKLVEELLTKGSKRQDRTGVGTLSKFGVQMRFNLNEHFPLLTTKKVFWRAIVEELLWFIKGDTNTKHLEEKGIKIWQKNTSREYLDKVGLKHLPEGDGGPIYGFQWRHYGAKYFNMYSDYQGEGYDQLKECIRLIREDPFSRRIVMSAWNPLCLKEMCLPPCHCLCQFYVEEKKSLSCQLFQRSSDMGSGTSFNIASYSLLTCMIASICNLEPKEFIHTIGDAHIYLNHVDVLKEQITRKPKPFPKLLINPSIKEIDQFKFEDFKLIGYESHPPLKMEMN